MKLHTTLLPQTLWSLNSYSKNWPARLEETLRASLAPCYETQKATQWQPDLDIADTGQELHITLDAPGMTPDNFEITVEENTLQIAGTRTPQPTSDHASTLLCERPSGAFQRTIALPYPVETQKIEATYKEGLLNIKLPKTAEAQPKKIAIKT